MAAAQPNPYHPGVSTVPPGNHFDAAASTANAFLHPQFCVQGNYQCGDEPEYSDGGSDDDDYFYQQQQIDYAELQRQDAEYESQLEQQDVHIPSILQYAAAPCKPTLGSAAQTQAPVYYQGPPASQLQQGPTIEESTGERCLPAPLTLDANNVVEEGDRPRLPSILSWADDADECLFGDREPSSLTNAENESCGDTDSPHDSDFFNLSSTSSTSPTKSASTESARNASFTNESFKQQQFLSALDAEIPDEVTRFPTTTTTTYCNYGYLQYSEFLDLDEQRSMVAEDRWRENASWIERHAEAAKFSSVGRKVAVKLLIDEAYRLDKIHVVEKYGPASEEAAQVTETWTKIGKEALAEMDSASPQMEFGGQCPDPSQNVIRKFSSMAIFIAGSGSRFYSENEEGKFTRLEAQAKVLDTLIFQGCLFVDELDY